MQTRFTAEQLERPIVAASEPILRKCVHCGFCTATCPTYVLLGDELDSPRGRIYLIKDMLENDRPATRDVVRHVDRCLSCLSCMTTCPSGVHYQHLIDHARVHVEQTYRRPFAERWLRAALAAVLPYPKRVRFALAAAALVRPFARFAPASLRALLELAPRRRAGAPQQCRFRALGARGTAQASRAADGLRANRDRARDQCGHDALAAAVRRRGRRHRRLLRCARPSLGQGAARERAGRCASRATARRDGRAGARCDRGQRVGLRHARQGLRLRVSRRRATRGKSGRRERQGPRRHGAVGRARLAARSSRCAAI